MSITRDLLHLLTRTAHAIRQRLHRPTDTERLAEAFDQIRPDLTADDVNTAVTDYLTQANAHSYRTINPQLAEDQAETRWVGDEHGLRDLPPVPQQPPITLDPADPNTAVIRAALDEADFITKHPRQKDSRTE
ncbi:hypothetical protein SEA_SOOS_18 [Gordonia phage Soos]|nr:hypothetical protein SEA_SOOS_18 [Gordonia phage Soos]